MRPLKETVSISLDCDLIEKMRFLADEDQRSLSQYVNLVLTAHLEQLDPAKMEKFERIQKFLKEN